MTYTADAAIKAASGQVGYRESGNNDTRYNHWLGTIDGTYRYAWCVSFQSWCADQAGGRANVDYPKTAGCLAAVSWFKSHDRWSSTPHVGDWVLYGPGGGTHVELVVAVSSTSITTIGGNTSGSLDGRYFNGDGVYRKQVSRASDRIYGYGRPAYTTQEDDMQLDDKVPVGTTYDRDFAHGSYPFSFVAIGAFAEAKRASAGVARVEAALAKLAQSNGVQVDVDEDAIVTGVLAGLTPERLAAAIPDDIAEQVVSALGARLTSKE